MGKSPRERIIRELMVWAATIIILLFWIRESLIPEQRDGELTFATSSTGRRGRNTLVVQGNRATISLARTSHRIIAHNRRTRPNNAAFHSDHHLQRCASVCF